MRFVTLGRRRPAEDSVSARSVRLSSASIHLFSPSCDAPGAQLPADGTGLPPWFTAAWCSVPLAGNELAPQRVNLCLRHCESLPLITSRKSGFFVN